MKTYTAFPWKNVACGVNASLVFAISALFVHAPIFFSVTMALLAFVGFRMLVGRDMTFEEAFPAVEGIASSDVAKALRSAEGALDRCKAVCSKMGGSDQKTALKGFITNADSVLEQVKAEPSLLPKVRRFLGSYLDDVTENSEKYLHLTGRESPERRAQFTQYLGDMRTIASKQEKALTDAEEFDLDVAMTAMTRRMARDL